LAEYSAHYPEIGQLGLGMAALSVDPPSRSAALKRSFGLPYLLLCDPERTVVSEWGLLNESEMGGIARPAVFVIDVGRTILFRSVDSTTEQVHAPATLAFVREWRAGHAQPEAIQRSHVFPGARERLHSALAFLGFRVRVPRSGNTP